MKEEETWHLVMSARANIYIIPGFTQSRHGNEKSFTLGLVG